MGGILSGILSAAEHPVRSAQQMNNGIVGGAHWLFPHNPFAHPGFQAEQFGHQLASSFDPRSRAGFLNLASLFVGGPKGDATPQMEALGMKGQFAPYGSETGTALDRGLVNEGPIRQGKGYNPSIQKMVERAHTNPFAPRASKGAVDDAYNQLSAMEKAKVRAVHAQAMRSKVDEHLGSAPMAGKIGQRYPEHDAALVHGPSFINHPSFLKGLLKRQYQAGAMHHN